MDYELQVTPHPSYQLEDSSEGSDWEQEERDEAAGTSKPQRLASEPQLSLRGNTSAVSKGREVVFLVGEAGERIAQGVEVKEEELAHILIDDEQCGTIASVNGITLVFLSTAISLASLHPLADFLLSSLSPSNATILASYHLPSYIPPTSSDGSDSRSDFTSRLPILTLRYPTSSSPSPLSDLTTNSLVEPYLPPNLLHGLPSSLMTLATLLPSQPPTTLLLLPTTTPPSPLNGPFSTVSPTSGTSITTMYDAGGPVGLSDPGSLFRQLTMTTRTGKRGKLVEIASRLGWSWWTPTSETTERSSGRGQAETKQGNGFAWLERERKSRRKEQVSSMFM